MLVFRRASVLIGILSVICLGGCVPNNELSHRERPGPTGVGVPPIKKRGRGQPLVMDGDPGSNSPTSPQDPDWSSSGSVETPGDDTNPDEVATGVQPDDPASQQVTSVSGSDSQENGDGGWHRVNGSMAGGPETEASGKKGGTTDPVSTS